MTRRRVLVSLVFLILHAGLASATQVQTVATDGGDIRITPILHGSAMIEYEGNVIYLDPWSRGDYADAPKATLVLVTDIHGDHLDVEMIETLRGVGTTLIVPAAAADKVEGESVLANGETQEVEGITIEAMPAYNLVRGPEEGKLFHDKGRGNGYILTMGGKRIYFAGDTECVPEIEALEDIDVAFLPMNLPYTMPPVEAAECVKAFRPAVVYPYHYRGSDLEEFSAALEDEEGIEVRVLDWYPASD